MEENLDQQEQEQEVRQEAQEQPVQEQQVESDGSLEAEGFENKDSVMNALKSFDSNIETIEVEANKETEPEATSGSGEQEQEQESEEQESTEKPNEEADEAESEGTEKEGKEEGAELKINNPMFGNKGLSIKEKEEAPEIKDLEEFNSKLKEDLGIDSYNDLTEKVNSWKTIEEDYKVKEKELDRAEDIFKNMDPVLYNAVKSNMKGENWREVIKNTPDLDFRKDVSDIESRKLVEAYRPGSFTDDDWEEFKDEDGDPNIKKAINMAIEVSKNAFTGEQSKASEVNARAVENNRIHRQKFETSVEGALGVLKEKMPNMDDNYIKEASKMMMENGIIDLFYNEDGTYKPESAVAYAMAKDGYNLFKEMEALAVNKAVKEQKNEETLAILERSDDKPRHVSGTSSTPSNLSSEAQQQLDMLKRIGGAQTNTF